MAGEQPDPALRLMNGGDTGGGEAVDRLRRSALDSADDASCHGCSPSLCRGYASSGFAALDRDELETFGTAFLAGMDPLEVGEKTLAGMTRNDAVIFTHPEFAEDFREIYEASIAALPDEPVPEGRREIERLRRAAARAAASGQAIGLSDLT
jgi:hypothetical protein